MDDFSRCRAARACPLQRSRRRIPSLLSFAPLTCALASCSTSAPDTVVATGGNGATSASNGGAPASGAAGSGATGAGGSSGSASGGAPGGAGVAGAAEPSGGMGTSGGASAAGLGGSGSAGAGNGGVSGGAGTAASAGSGASDGGMAGSAAAGGNGTAGASVAGTGGAGAIDCSPARALTPGDTTESVMVGGMARTFVRHVPPGHTGTTPVPVVIDFHPLGSSGSGWKGSTGWAELADQEGFIVIWPDGVGNSWNAGRCCRTAMEQNIDDIGFTRAIVARLEQDACIDPKRVYATGCSNGGGMAFRVACDAADVIAAVAPVDFDCVTSAVVDERSCGPECAPSRPISEIQFRGTADTAVPYEGGLRQGGTTTFPGAEQTFGSWGDINMCSGSPTALPSQPSCEQYPMCSDGVSTVLCTIQNGSHCGSYQSFDIVSVAWQMFQSKTLP